MSEAKTEHVPVLLDEVIAHLVTDPDGIYIDATFGRGGHSQAILAQLSTTGKLLALDRDPHAIAVAAQIKDDRFMYRHATFAEIGNIAKTLGIDGKIAGILLDIGVSSPQLEEAARGFSFLRDGPLDMRMDPTQGESVADWLAKVKELTLAEVIATYGEERHARRIAQAIVQARQTQPILRTGQLAEIVKAAHPRWPKDKHPATKTFQALRIFINGELEQLHKALPACVDILRKGGRLAVISFHSLEDRIFKQFIQKELQGDPSLVHFPLAAQTFMARLKKVGGAMRARHEEILKNPRSRSATLRIVEKIE